MLQHLVCKFNLRDCRPRLGIRLRRATTIPTNSLLLQLLTSLQPMWKLGLAQDILVLALVGGLSILAPQTLMTFQVSKIWRQLEDPLQSDPGAPASLAIPWPIDWGTGFYSCQQLPSPSRPSITPSAVHNCCSTRSPSSWAGPRAACWP